MKIGDLEPLDEGCIRARNRNRTDFVHDTNVVPHHLGVTGERRPPSARSKKSALPLSYGGLSSPIGFEPTTTRLSSELCVCASCDWRLSEPMERLELSRARYKGALLPQGIGIRSTGRIRTFDRRVNSSLPYHLATAEWPLRQESNLDNELRRLVRRSATTERRMTRRGCPALVMTSPAPRSCWIVNERAFPEEGRCVVRKEGFEPS